MLGRDLDHRRPHRRRGHRRDRATVTLAPNSAGNFYHRVALTPPYRVALRYQGRVRRMLTEPTSGDCNACHTAAGAEGAPGRVTLP
ncbi:MAG: hypothetical protein R3A52_28250 [Polyangiales bacterium]